MNDIWLPSDYVLGESVAWPQLPAPLRPSLHLVSIYVLVAIHRILPSFFLPFLLVDAGRERGVSVEGESIAYVMGLATNRTLVTASSSDGSFWRAR